MIDRTLEADVANEHRLLAALPLSMVAELDANLSLLSRRWRRAPALRRPERGRRINGIRDADHLARAVLPTSRAKWDGDKAPSPIRTTSCGRLSICVSSSILRIRMRGVRLDGRDTWAVSWNGW